MNTATATATNPNAQTIVIADNDESVVYAIQTRLQNLGYRCLPASSGAQALSLFQQGGVDLIISDLNMPSGNGVALARSVRAESKIPIIFITGFHDEFRRSMRGLPNISVLGKPFTAGTLIELVETHIALTPSRHVERAA